MTVLVTGATGDVGRHVTERLLADGMVVRTLCRAAPDGLPGSVEVAHGDLTAPETLDPAMTGVDAVVHCAAHLGGGGREVHRRVNVAGTMALLAAAQRARVGRVVHVSTLAVYGRKGDGQLVRPADGYDPFPELRDDYAWSKIAAERWVRLYRDRGGLDAVVLRPGIVYGGRRDFVARVARRGVGPLLVVLGSPEMLLPLVHVHDVAEAVLRALRTSCAPPEPLDLVGPDMPTQAEYLRRRNAARAERIVPVYVRAAGLLRRIAAVERARTSTGARLPPRLGHPVRALRRRTPRQGARLVPRYRSPARAHAAPRTNRGRRSRTECSGAGAPAMRRATALERASRRCPRGGAGGVASLSSALDRRRGDRRGGRHAALGLGHDGPEDQAVRARVRHRSSACRTRSPSRPAPPRSTSRSGCSASRRVTTSSCRPTRSRRPPRR